MSLGHVSTVAALPMHIASGLHCKRPWSRSANSSKMKQQGRRVDTNLPSISVTWRCSGEHRGEETQLVQTFAQEQLLRSCCPTSLIFATFMRTIQRSLLIICIGLMSSLGAYLQPTSCWTVEMSTAATLLQAIWYGIAARTEQAPIIHVCGSAEVQRICCQISPESERTAKATGVKYVLICTARPGNDRSETVNTPHSVCWGSSYFSRSFPAPASHPDQQKRAGTCSSCLQPPKVI